MKSKGMRPKYRFNDVVDDIRKDTVRIRYPKRAAKQLRESFKQTEIEKQNLLRRLDLQRQQYAWQGPWVRESIPTDASPEKKWQSERWPEERTNPEEVDMQCEPQTHEDTYCYNMDTDGQLDLRMAAQIQEERLECQFREFEEKTRGGKPK